MTTNRPMFSVVIPLYNKEKYIKRCLDSVLCQSSSDYELIVVDDGSIDSSLSVVLSYPTEKLRVISQENMGEGPARNRGVKEAIGEWIAFLDADDLWAPDHLEELRKIIDEFGDAGIVSAKPLEVRTESIPSFTCSLLPVRRRRIDFFRSSANSNGVLNSSSVAIRRTVFEEVGYFGNFKQGADTEFWSRICLRYPCAVSSKKTSFYCRGTGGVMEERWDPHGASGREIRSIRDIGAAVSYLLSQLENGDITREKRDSVIMFINSRITTELRIRLYNGQLEWMPSIAKLYLEPLSCRSRLWKLLAMLPGKFLMKIYRFRSFIRSWYRWLRRRIAAR